MQFKKKIFQINTYSESVSYNHFYDNVIEGYSMMVWLKWYCVIKSYEASEDVRMAAYIFGHYVWLNSKKQDIVTSLVILDIIITRLLTCELTV